MTKLHELGQLGQSVWYDNIQRSLIESGELQALLDAGVVGITSNPSIFEKAIGGSNDYDEAIKTLVASDTTAEFIYEAVAIRDIQDAADLLRPIYDDSDGVDGYVSLEVKPSLAHDTEGSIMDARRLFTVVDRPNVMIKIPGTPEGVPAIEQLISEGININVTLLFSLESYEAVIEAYLSGLERFCASDKAKTSTAPASVASFFISRVDTAVDEALNENGSEDAQALLGKIGIANAKVAYRRFQEIFSGERWQALADRGARVQRPLWASTSTKNPDYPDTLYVDSLIGPHTVNTVPPATLEAFRDHGTVAITLTKGVDEAQEQLAYLDELGVDLDAITQKLQDDGVASFAKSFDSLIDSVAEKKAALRKEMGESA